MIKELGRKGRNYSGWWEGKRHK